LLLAKIVVVGKERNIQTPKKNRRFPNEEIACFIEKWINLFLSFKNN